MSFEKDQNNKNRKCDWVRFKDRQNKWPHVEKLYREGPVDSLPTLRPDVVDRPSRPSVAKTKVSHLRANAFLASLAASRIVWRLTWLRPVGREQLYWSLVVA